MAERKILQYKALLYSFYPMGVDLLSPAESPILTHPTRYIVGLVAYIAWAISMLIFNFQNFTTIDAAASFLLLFTQTLLSWVKMTSFLFYGKEHKQLIGELEKLGAQANGQEFVAWHAAHRRGIFITRLYYLAVLITVFVYLLSPLPQIAYKYLKTGEFKLLLPFEGVLPYDLQQVHNYFFTYIVTFIAVQFIGNSATGIDSLFFWYVQNVAAHFRILIVKLETVVCKMHEHQYADFQLLISETLSYHHRAFALSTEFNRIFTPILFANVTFDCTLICFLAYIFGTSADLTGLPFTVMAACAILSQLVMYCFGGGIIQTESESVSNNLYLLFPWERMSPRMKRLMLLPLMRAQRVSKLTGVFFVLDRSLLVWILRTAFSFTALLFAVTNKEGMLI